MIQTLSNEQSKDKNQKANGFNGVENVASVTNKQQTLGQQHYYDY